MCKDSGPLPGHYPDGLVHEVEAGLSDLALLSSALEEAVTAHRAGVIVGPGVDEVALRRAECRARRADAARRLCVPDGAA
jgi:hypothetical protein